MVLALCREVDKSSGRIFVYPLHAQVTDELLSDLHVRALVNPELSYFVVKADFWDDPDMRADISKHLKQKSVSAEELRVLFGMYTLNAR